MTAENKPNFRTDAVEFIKGVGLMLRLAFDPTQDPLWIEWRQNKKSTEIKPDSLIDRIKSTINDVLDPKGETE